MGAGTPRSGPIVRQSPPEPDFDVHAAGDAAAHTGRARPRLARRIEAFLDRHLRPGTRDWAAACHLLPLAAYAAPIPGLSALVAWGVWRLKRDSEPGVSAHGREALNMQLNVSALSALTLPLFPLWIAVNGVAIFLAAKAGLRAAAAESWRYPFVLRVV